VFLPKYERFYVWHFEKLSTFADKPLKEHGS